MLKIILSTGQGRLHLIQSAVSLKKAGVKIKVITGWIPGKLFSDKVINRLGGLVGRRNNLAGGLKKRVPAELDREQLKSCGFAEFMVQFLFKLSSYKILKRADSAVLGWKLFGMQSKSYISDAAVFHVRSGAGSGGAIKKARRKGMKVLVDHSIAHPAEMLRQLDKSLKGSDSRINRYESIHPDDKFWKMVLDDCLNGDMLVVNSDYVKDSFVAEGYPESKIKVVQLGVNTEFQNGNKQYNTDGKLRLIFTGGFGRRKGALLIIEAVDALINKQVNFSLDIVGSVMNDIEIPEWFKSHPSVKMHGHLPQSEMRPLLLNSDLYVFPTYTEGSAQSVKEAMALGLAVITTRQSGAPVSHRQNGFIIADNDAQALLNAILELKDDRKLQEEMGRNAAHTIQSEHTWDLYARGMINVYNEMTTS